MAGPALAEALALLGNGVVAKDIGRDGELYGDGEEVVQVGDGAALVVGKGL